MSVISRITDSFVSPGILLSVCAAVFISGCVTSDLTSVDPDEGEAALVLYLMASSDVSTQCIIAAIDGRDVTGLQSWRLTTEYLLPAGLHTYGFVCEESAGSIAVRDYSFDMVFSLAPNGRYGLIRQLRPEHAACIVVQDLNNKSGFSLAEHCEQ